LPRAGERSVRSVTICADSWPHGHRRLPRYKDAVPRIAKEPGPGPPTEARTTRPSRLSAASTKIKVGRSVTPQPRSNRAKRTSSGKGNREDGGLQRWRLRVRHHVARVELAGSRNEEPFVVQRSQTDLAFD